ncbi:hypothetical protein UFOVP696_3 [uncultured Caudovirales phage]|uniref:Uncharacterized protein n=1 Tax=uncultured Caudovirales phage TaxID=2100421 RepID=A0A6J5MIW3_9CAUD|nr:hypothetical protein UFOVP429_10 [uncultured Caudovirales phage]CAB4158098.1 hypothetical protein UFOVP696_3 [uncultured Caudovirales phage]
MPQTYEPIATQTLGSNTSQVTFSSIPSTYTDLVIISAPIGTGDAQMFIRYNNDGTSSYGYTLIASNGSSVTPYRTGPVLGIGTDYFFSITAAGGVTLINVMNYSNTTTFKTAFIHANNATKSTIATVGVWQNTAAINRIDLYATSASFATGSVFTIYGIKAA